MFLIQKKNDRSGAVLTVEKGGKSGGGGPTGGGGRERGVRAGERHSAPGRNGALYAGRDVCVAAVSQWP